MQILNRNTGLYTDHYELGMAQGYFQSGMRDMPAVFDYFFRNNPYEGGYVVFAGLEDLLDMLENYRFDKDDCDHLEQIGFDREFLGFLKDFRFEADVYSVMEGEVVFPYEPCVRVEGNIIETQLIETLLLNILNFESLIATKAARIRQVAGDRMLMDFGLRRAHGLGGIHASRAAIAGGFDKTSNVYSAFHFGLESAGTMAHSWVQSFEDEYTAFRTFANIFPENCILLADTYDTLKSGFPNAIKVGKEMERTGKQLFGIRLDSGDLAYLSKKGREMLDSEGLDYVKIVASNQLDEYVIKSLMEQSAPIDVFGVGTALVTGMGAGALDGVYKLCQINGKQTLKISDNITKITLPGKKSSYRFRDDKGMFTADGIALDEETDFDIIHHPFEAGKSSNISGCKQEQLIHKVMNKGRKESGKKSPGKISEYAQSRLQFLPGEQKRFMNPHIYKVGISSQLLELRQKMTGKAIHK
ncbi:MAG: nicotinate phosphoribosyltransferase [Bacteroides sp. SM23_62]|nr:MAG: nicotinate phosphoribosyltransferase [Bacteroides sp. SM23_62]